jgi:hypothetical protein
LCLSTLQAESVAGVQTELDYWFSAEPPACSVLWLMGDLQADLVPALVRVGAGLAPLRRSQRVRRHREHVAGLRKY